jgi:GMP synthase-like glutamine amidotransferase
VAVTRPVRIGVLRMCELPDAGLPVHGPYLRLLEMLFARHAVELLDVPVHEGATPASLADADGWIATGSPASVYDDLDWIRTAEEIVRAAAASETPLVGICFGHQLVAQALGGRVERAAVGWGVGARRYETVVDRGPVPGTSTTLLASHQDQVVAAPPGAVVWSTAEYCPIAGLGVGERMWTVQGHPEFTPELVTAIYESRRERIGGDAVDAARRTLTTPLSNAAVADAIVELVTPRSAPARPRA